MGRPPIGERAMTEAERKRRLRALAKGRIAEPAASLRQTKLPDHAALVQELAQAKARIKELEQQQAARADDQQVDAVLRRREEKSEQNAGAHRPPARQTANPQTEPREDDDLLRTGDKLKIGELQEALGHMRELLARAEAKLAVMPPAERDREVERLKTRNRNLTLENREMAKWVKDEVARIKRQWLMPQAIFNAVVKCLHPDQRESQTPRQIDEACGQLTEWKKAQDARRRARH